MIALNNKQKLLNLLSTGREYSKETLVKFVSHRFSEYVRQLRADGHTINVWREYGTNWYRLQVPERTRPTKKDTEPTLFD